MTDDTPAKWECVTCGTVYDPTTDVPVGDDTPAPTAKIAGPAGAGDAAPRQTGACQPTGPAAGGSAGSTNPTGSPAPTMSADDEDLPTPAMQRMDLRVIGLKADAIMQRERAEKAEAEVRALHTRLDAAHSVIRKVLDGPGQPLTPDECDAMRTATENPTPQPENDR